VKRDFDLIVYGATGYTGRLIAEYLATSYRGDDAPLVHRPPVTGRMRYALSPFHAATT
jgi:short subunit dehydrogenase-like uncharacterized protein